MVAILVLVAIAWAFSGPPALVLDWTRRFDLSVGDLAVCVLVGSILGPLAWLIWWTDGKDFGAGRVLIKRRRT